MASSVPEPYLTGRTSALKVEEIVNILRIPDDSKAIQTVPAMPRGGEVYLYKITSGMREDIWKDDGYHFRSDGTRKQPASNPRIEKQYHKAYTEDKVTTRAFVREASYLYKQPVKHVLVQYIGDHTKAQPAPQRKRRGRQPLHSFPKYRKLESTSVNVQSGDTVSTDSSLEIKGHSSPNELEGKGNINTVSKVILNDATPSIGTVSRTSVHGTGNDHDTSQRPCRTMEYMSDGDIEYLGSTSGSPVKKPRLQPQAESDNTVVSYDIATDYGYLYRFLESVERNRDVIKVVQRVLALSRFWNKDCINKNNPCWTLIDEVEKKWTQDTIKARNWVKCSVNTDGLSFNQDRLVYINLIAAVLVGACHTRTEVHDFVKTLEDHPPHLQNVQDYSLSRDCTYTVGCYTIRGDVLSRLETNEWLTDEIMDTYLHLLEREWCSRVSFHCLVLPTETVILWEAGQYTDKIRGRDENLANYTWILMPVNMPRNQHWVLLVANVRDGTVGVVNSKPALGVEDTIVQHWRSFVHHWDSTSWKIGTPLMKRQYEVVEQADGHNCGIFVLMAADALLAETSPGIMRNCHAEKYRLYVLQRILQYAKGDIQGGGNHPLAVDVPNVAQQSETLTEEDIMERNYTKETKQVICTVGQHHDPLDETEVAVVTDKGADNYPCLDGHLLDKQRMACLLMVALAENKLEKRLLWAVSDTGTRVERETYKRYIAWALKVFEINAETYTNKMMQNDLTQLSGCCLCHEAGSYRIRNHMVAIRLRDILVSSLRQLIEKMDLEFIFRYVSPRVQPTDVEKLGSPFGIELMTARRFAAAVQGREFAFVCMHSLFQEQTFVDMVFENLLQNLDKSALLKLLSSNDTVYGHSFLFWASASDNSKLLRKALTTVQFSVGNRKEALFASCFSSTSDNFDFLFSQYNGKLETMRMTMPHLPRPLIIKLNLAVVDDLGITFDNISLLDIACMSGLSAVAFRLLQVTKTSSRSRKGSRKTTHVHYASMCQKEKTIMDTIIKMGLFNLNIVDPSGSSPLHYACAVGNVRNVSILLQKAVGSGKQNKKGETGLHLACFYGNVEVVKLLLQNKGTKGETDNNGNTPLHKAAWQGQTEVVEVLLKNKANVDVKESDGDTPLHKAAWQGQTEVVEVLLKNKANVNEKGMNGRTPLHNAALQGQTEVVEVLLKNKANVDEKKKNGRTPLHDAALQGQTEVVEVLLKNKANVDEKEKNGRTPLHDAALQGQTEVVEVLLKNKANVDEKEKNGRTPLHDAALQGQTEVVEVLLKNKANVDVKDSDGDTPLHVSAWQEQTEVVEVLLKNKAKVDEKGMNGRTPLHDAALQGHTEVVEVLLENKANIDEKGMNGRTPLHDAAWQGQTEVVEVLLKNKANVDEKEKNGRTPLHDAALQGQTEVVEVLLKNKANVDVKDSDGDTPLHDAAWQEQTEVVEVLLKNKANVDEKGMNGRTPLHDAALQGQTEVVEVLLKNKANVDEKEKNGRTPLHDAALQGRTEVVEVLLKNKANVDEKDNDGHTPLHDAALKGQTEVVEVLLKNKANVDEKKKNGRTPLHDAAWQGQTEVVEVLLKNKANVDEKDNDGRTPLHDAAWQGQTEVVEVLLKNKANVDEKKKNGRTPLHDAALQGQTEVVEVLLKNKANVDVKDSDGDTPLHDAAWQEQTEVVEVLLKNKANVDEKGMNGRTPLHKAALQGRTEVVEVLLKNKANVDEKDNDGGTPLHDAAWQGQTEVVEVLLENKANIDEKGMNGRTPLHHAARKGRTEVVEVLLKNKANVDEKEKNGRTPLHDAALQGQTEVVEVLLKNKANVDEKGMNGRTPLHKAALQGRTEVVEVLLKNKANVDEKDNDGHTPLHDAALKGQTEVVEVLLKNKANVDEKKKNGRTPLHDAAWQGQTEVVEVLLKNKANVDEKDNDGRTPLHDAAWQGQTEVVEVLLKNKANVDEKEKNGRTPLHDAALQGQTEVVEVLLKNKANVDVKDSDGDTPLHDAAWQEQTEVVEVLLKNKANVDEKGMNGRTPLHKAALQGRTEVVEVLLKNKANVDEKDNDGHTPLHDAALQGQTEVVEVLLKNKANVDEKDNDGCTPLHDAAWQGQTEVVEVLLKNKANVDEKDNDGRTPLHDAAWQGQTEVVEVLLKNKANVDEKDNDGRTPLNHAALRGYQEVVKVLKNRANDLEKDNNEDTPSQKANAHYCNAIASTVTEAAKKHDLIPNVRSPPHGNCKDRGLSSVQSEEAQISSKDSRSGSQKRGITLQPWQPHFEDARTSSLHADAAHTYTCLPSQTPGHILQVNSNHAPTSGASDCTITHYTESGEVIILHPL